MKTLTGKTITLDVEASDTIDNVKVWGGIDDGAFTQPVPSVHGPRIHHQSWSSPLRLQLRSILVCLALLMQKGEAASSMPIAEHLDEREKQVGDDDGIMPLLLEGVVMCLMLLAILTSVSQTTRHCRVAVVVAVGALWISSGLCYCEAVSLSLSFLLAHCGLGFCFRERCCAVKTVSLGRAQCLWNSLRASSISANQVGHSYSSSSMLPPAWVNAFCPLRQCRRMGKVRLSSVRRPVFVRQVVSVQKEGPRFAKDRIRLKGGFADFEVESIPRTEVHGQCVIGGALPDGNCWWRSVQEVIGLPWWLLKQRVVKDQVNALRASVGRSHRSTLLSFQREQRKKGAWATQDTIALTAEWCRVRFNVVTDEAILSFGDCGPTVWIHHSRSHFRPVFDASVYDRLECQGLSSSGSSVACAGGGLDKQDKKPQEGGDVDCLDRVGLRATSQECQEDKSRGCPLIRENSQRATQDPRGHPLPRCFAPFADGSDSGSSDSPLSPCALRELREFEEREFVKRSELVRHMTSKLKDDVHGEGLLVCDGNEGSASFDVKSSQAGLTCSPCHNGHVDSVVASDTCSLPPGDGGECSLSLGLAIIGECGVGDESVIPFVHDGAGVDVKSSQAGMNCSPRHGESDATVISDKCSEIYGNDGEGTQSIVSTIIDECDVGDELTILSVHDGSRRSQEGTDTPTRQHVSEGHGAGCYRVGVKSSQAGMSCSPCRDKSVRDSEKCSQTARDGGEDSQSLTSTISDALEVEGESIPLVVLEQDRRVVSCHRKRKYLALDPLPDEQECSRTDTLALSHSCCPSVPKAPHSYRAKYCLSGFVSQEDQGTQRCSSSTHRVCQSELEFGEVSTTLCFSGGGKRASKRCRSHEQELTPSEEAAAMSAEDQDVVLITRRQYCRQTHSIVHEAVVKRWLAQCLHHSCGRFFSIGSREGEYQEGYEGDLIFFPSDTEVQFGLLPPLASRRRRGVPHAKVTTSQVGSGDEMGDEALRHELHVLALAPNPGSEGFALAQEASSSGTCLHGGGALPSPPSESHGAERPINPCDRQEHPSEAVRWCCPGCGESECRHRKQAFTEKTQDSPAKRVRWCCPGCGKSECLHRTSSSKDWVLDSQKDVCLEQVTIRWRCPGCGQAECIHRVRQGSVDEPVEGVASHVQEPRVEATLSGGGCVCAAVLPHAGLPLHQSVACLHDVEYFMQSHISSCHFLYVFGLGWGRQQLVACVRYVCCCVTCLSNYGNHAFPSKREYEEECIRCALQGYMSDAVESGNGHVQLSHVEATLSGGGCSSYRPPANVEFSLHEPVMSLHGVKCFMQSHMSSFHSRYVFGMAWGEQQLVPCVSYVWCCRDICMSNYGNPELLSGGGPEGDVKQIGALVAKAKKAESGFLPAQLRTMLLDRKLPEKPGS